MRTRALVVALAVTSVLASGAGTSTRAAPAARDDAGALVAGRVFPDPHGCLAYGVPDLDGDGVKDTPPGVSPWATGRVCATGFLTYEEVIEGARYLEHRLPRFVDLIRLDEAYEDPTYRSAGLPRSVAVTEDGTVKPLGRDRRPLYMIKVTDSASPVDEADREHFAYSLSIHGPERAGLEGGIRAMEDLVTWAACEADPAALPACADEGPFPRRIVEDDPSAPTAGDAARGGVYYFLLPNPDGWARGEAAPVQFRDGGINANHRPGAGFQRYNGNGVDLNRDWPTLGYTYRLYSPASEPEVRAFSEALLDVRDATSAGRFTGSTDLHGMLNAPAFSFSMLSATEADWRENHLAVDAATRTWAEQTRRLAWSPYVGGGGTGLCLFGQSCVANMWGTTIDTIGYTISGGLGDWMASPVGLDGIGVDNEMVLSHVFPNTVFEHTLVQTQVDGNRGLIRSQIAALFDEDVPAFDPGGRVAYVNDPVRLQRPAATPVPYELPTQEDIDVLLPCAPGPSTTAGCGAGEFVPPVDSPPIPGEAAYIFEIAGPDDGVHVGGMHVTATIANADGVAPGLGHVKLDRLVDGAWVGMAGTYKQEAIYLEAGRVVTFNDPPPGTWRARVSAHDLPMRLTIDLRGDEAEGRGGQAVDASPMDAFGDLAPFSAPGRAPAPLAVEAIAADPDLLGPYDTVVVAGDVGRRTYLADELGLDEATIDGYVEALRSFASGGGNLVLTDGALTLLADLGLLEPRHVQAHAARAGGCGYRQPTTTFSQPSHPLAEGVFKPGAAGGSRRLTVEPTPLGYTPDCGHDPEPSMTVWDVDASAWRAACGLPDCLVANPGVGEARYGDGRVRTAGLLLPKPVLHDAVRHDMRYGVASYALTYAGWELLENLLTYTRPA